MRGLHSVLLLLYPVALAVVQGRCRGAHLSLFRFNYPSAASTAALPTLSQRI